MCGSLPTSSGRMCSNVREIGHDAGHVQAALVREGVAPHVGLVGVGRDVAELGDEVRDLGQPGEVLVGDAVAAHRQLEGGDDGAEVGVAAALPVAVDRALDVEDSLLDGDQAVGHGAAGVVVGVDAQGYGAAQCLPHFAHGPAQAHGESGPVGVAEDHGLGPRLDRGAEAAKGVIGMGLVRVEEVLGIVDHPLALLPEEGDRLRDHAQVLVAIDAQDLLDVQVPGLTHDARHRRPQPGQRAQHQVVGRRDPAPAGHAEGRHHRFAQVLPGHALEEGRVLGVRSGEAALDHVDAQLGQADGDAHLLVHGDAQPLALHAVAQGGVVQDDVPVGAHGLSAASLDDGRLAAVRRARARPDRPACRCCPRVPGSGPGGPG